MEPAVGVSHVGGIVAERVRRKAARNAEHKRTKREAAVARAKAVRKTPPRNDTRTAEEKAVQTATAIHTRAINDQRRKAGRERTAVARAKAQVAKVAAAVAGGILLPEAPEIRHDPVEPLHDDPGPVIALKLKSIGARLRDGSLRGEKDVNGRSLIPPAQLMTLPGIQAISAAIRFLPGGRDRFIEYVQLGALNADEICLKFWQIWAELTPAERQIASFDDVVAAAGIKPAELLGRVVTHAVNMGLDAGRLIMATAHPQVLDASITAALRQDPLGQTERFRLLEAQGVLPVPQKGPVVAISANATAQAGAMAAGSPSAPMLSPFAAALQAASTVRDEVIEGVIVADEARAERKALKPPDPFAAALDAGVDAREVDRDSLAAVALGRRVG